MRTSRGAIGLVGLLVIAVTTAFESATAQSTVVVAGGFTPANQVLFATNFSQDPIGSFPSGLKHVKGPLEVVTYNGVLMLRAIGPAEFLMPLSAPLPQDFTLEFDFIPRTGAGHEIAFEGGPVAKRDVSSAEILWNHQIATIMGGGQGMAQVTLPYALQAQLVGKRAKLEVAMSGTQFKLFTNGLRLYNLPTLAFQRTNVLRIFVGGVDDAAQAIYLAGIRLATNGPTTTSSGAPSGGGVASSQPTASGAPRTGGTILSGGPTSKLPLTIVPPPPSISTAPAAYNQPNQLPVAQASQSQSQTTQPPAAGPFVPGPSTLGGMLWPGDIPASGVGVAIIWTPVANAASYRVYRTVLGSVLPAQPLFTISDADAATMATEHASVGLGGYRMAIDPFLTAANIFWVDAIFSDGSISGLSPSYTMVSQGFTKPWGVVKNLTATLGPTTTVTTWDRQFTDPGRTVSWTWDPLPSAIVYEIRIVFITPGSASLVPPYDETLLTSQAPELTSTPPSPVPSVVVPLRSRGYRTGPPFLMGVLTGMGVVFCVAIVRDPTNPTTPLPPSISACDTRVIP